MRARILRPGTEVVQETEHTFKDEEQSGAATAVSVRPHLFVVLECDRVHAGGARYELTNIDEVIIGRGPTRCVAEETIGTCRRLMLQLPGRSLSALHARFRRRGVDWYVEDAGSTNGSYVNGQRVDSALLRDGDCVEVGHTLISLGLAVPTPGGAGSFDSLNESPSVQGLATVLPSLQAEYAQMTKVARSSLSIVIVGKSGSGKEVVARAVHGLSGRKGPFVPVNCGTLNSDLSASQLFGHVRGAFTGAIREHVGFVRSAHQGTLFLDEIGDLPKQAQVSLLRVLQESEVVPIGSAQSLAADIRIVAAAHESLAQLVVRGALREDFRARLEGFVIELRPLCERREDLGILLAALAASAALPPFSIHPAAGLALWSYDWPLNVRELQQIVQRALVLSGDNQVRTEHLPSEMRRAARRESAIEELLVRPRSFAAASLSDADQKLRSELIGWLTHHRGNVTKIARSLGKARMQVQRWLRRYELDPSAYRYLEP